MKATKYSNYWVQLTFDSKAERDVVADATSFAIPGAQFSQQYKAGVWDGRKKFLTPANKLPAGLFASLFPNNKLTGDPDHVDFAFDDLHLYNEFPTFDRRQYQLDAVNAIFKRRRGIIQAVVGSGKSLISAVVARQHLSQSTENKVLFVTYDKNILTQTVENYKSLGFKVSQFGDGKRDFGGEVVVATVQSLSRIKEATTVLDKFTMTFSDECFPGTTKIITEDGLLTLSDINKRKYSGKVLSRNSVTGEFEYKNITGYLKKPRTHVVGSIGLGAATRITSTANHEILTQRGYIRADTITRDDVIIARQGGQDAFPLIDTESMAYQVAVASALGDGSITPPHSDSLVYRLRINQGIAQAEYCDFKMRWFDYIGHSPSNLIQSGYTKKQSIYSRTTKGSPTFTKIAVMSKVDRINALDLRGLGILFLDDGSLHHTNGSLHCNSFSLEETTALVNKMTKFGIAASLSLSNKGYYYINIKKAGMEVLAPHIARSAPPCLRYKVPDSAKHIACIIPTQPKTINYGMCVRSTFTTTTKQVPNVYCIEVEDNHNFVLANGVVVHNCHHAKSKTSREAFTKLKNCKYFIGLTATPPEEGTLDHADLTAVTGPTIYKFGFAEAVAEKNIAPIKVFFVKVKSDEETFEKLMFRKNYKLIWDIGIKDNKVRNSMIADINKHLLDTYANAPSLICVDRTEHGAALATALRNVKSTYHEMYGEDNIFCRSDKKKDLSEGRIPTIISSVITEGVDLPVSPIVAINAMGRVSPTKAIQFFGRAVRKNPIYKSFRVAIDFIDDSNRLLYEHSMRRVESCKDFGLETQIVDNLSDLYTAISEYYTEIE